MKDGHIYYRYLISKRCYIGFYHLYSRRYDRCISQLQAKKNWLQMMGNIFLAIIFQPTYSVLSVFFLLLLCFIVFLFFFQGDPIFVPIKFDDKSSGAESDESSSNFSFLFNFHWSVAKNYNILCSFFQHWLILSYNTIILLKCYALLGVCMKKN